MRHLKTSLEELEISYTMPIQPILLPTSGQPPSMSQLRSSSFSGLSAGQNLDLGNAGGFHPTALGVVPGRAYRSGTPVDRPTTS